MENVMDNNQLAQVVQINLKTLSLQDTNEQMPGTSCACGFNYYLQLLKLHCTTVHLFN